MPDGKSGEANGGRTDWAALRAMSDDDIDRLAAEDDENPAMADESEWERANDALPRGLTSIRVNFDRDVVDFFRREGLGYQRRMNAVLRRYMNAQQGRDEARPTRKKS